jgi:hypothetical protein
MCSLMKAITECSQHCCRIIHDGTFTCKVKSTFHTLSKGSGQCQWCRQHIIVTPCRSHGHKGIRPMAHISVLQWVTMVSLGHSRDALPNIPLRTAIWQPTMTSSPKFSMMAVASPVTNGWRTGAQYKFQNRNNYLLLKVDIAT